MKDGKIMMTRNDLHISTRAIYFGRWPVNRIVEDTMASSRQRFELRHFELSMCSAWGTWCACVYLVRNCTVTCYLCNITVEERCMLRCYLDNRLYKLDAASSWGEPEQVLIKNNPHLGDHTMAHMLTYSYLTCWISYYGYTGTSSTFKLWAS